ncbi:TPA: Lrp/AsnC family transcriptional regulator [Candidatus Poribacteria bacterium]|nr:Lrp/AsnC family transcriptional regulator [Candidatus Poribacteria bacterium]HEX30567.1 Lrp/AsnC family transcriptional regulator [Candidatus Poribacteria bacterium]
MMLEKERELLRELSDIPIVKRPFREIAEKLRVSEEWVLRKIEELMGSGAIRRFGVILNHFRAGFSENALLLWRTETPGELGMKFAALPWVSHCYRRRSYPQLNYQLYTMVHAGTREELLERIKRMREIAGSEPLVLLTRRCFKKSSFEV